MRCEGEVIIECFNPNNNNLEPRPLQNLHLFNEDSCQLLLQSIATNLGEEFVPYDEQWTRFVLNKILQQIVQQPALAKRTAPFLSQFMKHVL